LKSARQQVAQTEGARTSTGPTQTAGAACCSQQRGQSTAQFADCTHLRVGSHESIDCRADPTCCSLTDITDRFADVAAGQIPNRASDVLHGVKGTANCIAYCTHVFLLRV
jgi:hypothetical protein